MILALVPLKHIHYLEVSSAVKQQTVFSKFCEVAVHVVPLLYSLFHDSNNPLIYQKRRIYAFLVFT